MSKTAADQILADDAREKKLPTWAQNELRSLRQARATLLEAVENFTEGKETNVEFGHKLLGHERHGYLPEELPIRFKLDDMGHLEFRLQDRFGDVPVVRLHASAAYHFELAVKPVAANAVDLTFVPRAYESKLPKGKA